MACVYVGAVHGGAWGVSLCHSLGSGGSTAGYGELFPPSTFPLPPYLFCTRVLQVSAIPCTREARMTLPLQLSPLPPFTPQTWKYGAALSTGDSASPHAEMSLISRILCWGFS